MSKSSPRTDAQLRKELRKVGMCVKKVDGEYRVNKCGRRSDAAAYFTNDRNDALYSGMAMAAESGVRAAQAQQRARIHDDERGFGATAVEHGRMKDADKGMFVAYSRMFNEAIEGKDCVQALDRLTQSARLIGSVQAHVVSAKRPMSEVSPGEHVQANMERVFKQSCLRDSSLNSLGNISVKPGARVTYSMGAGKSSSGKVTYAGSDVVMVKRDGGGTDTIFYGQIQQVLSSGKSLGAIYPTVEE